MDSIQTKKKDHVKMPNLKCIGQVVIIPEPSGFRVYVAWEWEECAREGFFAFYRSRLTCKEVTEAKILDTCDWGWELEESEAKKIFYSMF